MDSYLKTYENDIFFFIPMTTDTPKVTFSKMAAANKRTESTGNPDEERSYGDLYCDTLNEHVMYECNASVFKQLDRFYLGEFTLACYNDDYDGTVFDTEKVHLFVTAHKKTGIYIVTLGIHDNLYIPTQLIDQMSTNHLDILNEKNGKYENISDYMNREFSLYLCGNAKCVACLSNEPKDKAELVYILSGETYVSEHIDYKIREAHYAELLQNRACYDYYDSYISNSVIAFIFKEYSNDLAERLERETSELFIVEIVLFQNTAVHRTNKRVVEELYETEGVTNEEIERLYLEFGNTMKFWSTDIYKYPFSQKEADEVIKIFGIDAALEDYHRNQAFIDRLIEIRSNIASEKSDSRMNFILYFLAWIQVVGILVSGYAFVFSDILSKTAYVIGGIIFIALQLVVALIVYFNYIVKKTKRRR